MRKITSLWVGSIAAAGLVSYLTGHGQHLGWRDAPFHTTAVFLMGCMIFTSLAMVYFHGKRMLPNPKPLQAAAVLLELPLALFGSIFLSIWFFPSL